MNWVACVGVDWGERGHTFVEQASNGSRSRGQFSASGEGVHEWVAGLRERHPSGPVGVIVEQSRGSLIYALMAYEFIEIIPINPRQSKAYRASRRPSGASSDHLDASLLCDYGVKHQDELRVWKPDDPLTRRLRFLVETRRKFVDQRTAFTHQLRAALNLYFPQALEWIGGEGSAVLLEFMSRWPTLEALCAATPDEILEAFRAARCRKCPEKLTALLELRQAARPITADRATIETAAMQVQALVTMIQPVNEAIRQYDKAIAEAWALHPDRELFESFPGAGPVMAPRLAVAFGTDRTRYGDSSEVQCYSGIAPVTEQSGKSCWVHARWNCPKFLKQSFHEFAQASIPKSPWAKAVYQQQIRQGAAHHAAIRALAFRWIRILFAIWRSHSRFDEAIHLQRLAAQRSPIAQLVVAA
ncbi:MAG: IS110 family transposase [Rhodococcus sp. (in: high G+C Gram-positive bacteria)]